MQNRLGMSQVFSGQCKAMSLNEHVLFNYIHGMDMCVCGLLLRGYMYHVLLCCTCVLPHSH